MNDLRNENIACLYCGAPATIECENECFTKVFVRTVLNSPPFVPSNEISVTVGRLLADEIISYMSLVTKAIDELGFMGRMSVLAKDYDELHQFARSLIEAEAFTHPKQVVEFYTNPDDWKQASAIWAELDRPVNKKQEGWDIFKQVVEAKIGK